MKSKSKLSKRVHYWTPEDDVWTCRYCKKSGFITKSELDHHEKECESNPKREIDKPPANNIDGNITSKPIKNNKSATIGLVLSLLAIFGIGLAGIIGMILGIVALTQIKYTHEKGKIRAIVAIIIGFTWSFGIGILRQLVAAGY